VRWQGLEAGAVEHPDALACAHEIVFSAVEVFESQESQCQQLDLGKVGLQP